MQINDLMVGDILLVKGQNWLSRTIHKLTKSEYSHACCYVGYGKIIESAQGGVQINPITDYKEYTIIRHIDYNPTNKQKFEDAVDWMIMQEGKGYDYLGLIGIGWTLFTNRPRNIFDRKDRYWCSELVADGYISQGIMLDVSPRTFKVSPGDLHRSIYMKEVAKNVTF